MKMNKSQAIEAAKNLARTSTANGMTVDEINNLGDYSERRTAAARLYLPVMLDMDVHENYRAAAQEAFVDAVLNIWGSKVKQLENARRAWKSAISGITVQQAHEKVQALVASMNIRGAEIDANGVRICRLDRYSDAQLYWTFDRDFGADGLRNPDDEKQRAGVYTLSLKISCSGTSYTPAKMAVINKIHTELVDVANEIEVVMANEHIIWTWGIPEVVPVPPVDMSTDDRLS